MASRLFKLLTSHWQERPTQIGYSNENGLPHYGVGKKIDVFDVFGCSKQEQMSCDTKSLQMEHVCVRGCMLSHLLTWN